MVRKAKLDGRDTVGIRDNCGIPVCTGTEVSSDPLHPRFFLAASTPFFFSLLIITALFNEMQTRFCCDDSQPPRPVEIIENVGKPIANKIEHPKVSHTQSNFCANSLPRGILDPNSNFNRIAGTIVLLVCCDIHRQQYVLRREAA